jgi:hypothetical protein
MADGIGLGILITVIESTFHLSQCFSNLVSIFNEVLVVSEVEMKPSIHQSISEWSLLDQFLEGLLSFLGSV